jgi:hypothetical protein
MYTVREGAARMLASALEAEVDAYVAAVSGSRHDNGHALVVRNGKARPRSAVTGAVALEVPSARSRRSRVEFGDKWPKAVTKIVDVQEALLAFYDFRDSSRWRMNQAVRCQACH